jgi:amino acid permease
MDEQYRSEQVAPLLINTNDEFSHKDVVHEAKSSMFGTVFNLLCTAIGGGVLAFPFIYAQTGIILGLAIIVLMVPLLFYSQHLICVSSEHFDADHYNTIAQRLPSKIWGVMCNVILILYLIGAVIAFMTLIGELGTGVLHRWVGHGASTWYTSKAVVISAFCIIVVLPPCLKKSVAEIAWISALALLPIFYLAVLVIIDGAAKIVQHSTAEVSYAQWNINCFYALPMIVFAYQSHVTSPPIYAAQKEKTLKNMDKALVIVYVVETVLYVVFGIMGYVQFGSNAQGNILLNYSDTDIKYLIARASLVLHFTLAIPINFFPIKTAIYETVFKREIKEASLVEWRYLLSTFVPFFLCMTLAILAPGIQVVFSLIGSTLGVVVIFLFPAVFAWHLNPRRLIFVVLAVLAGVSIGITGTVTTVYELF